MKKSISLSILFSILTLCIFSFTPIQLVRPDLKVISIIPSILGNNLVLKIKIKNIGNANAREIFDNNIELNNINEPSPNPKRIQTRLIAGLNAKETKIIEVIYPAASVHSGDRKVTVITDSKSSQISESNENNNTRIVAIPSI